jgi:uncharacterized protein YjiS (DUF1127 family)
MSCRGTTCSSINSSDVLRDLSDVARSSLLMRVFARIGAILDRFRQREISIAFEKVRQRHILLELDDRLLSDIGLTRDQAEREARKPFWK